MDELTTKIEYMVEKNSDKIVEFIKHMYHICPEEVEIMLEHVAEGKQHITKRQQYEDKVNKLKWANKQGTGAKWKLEDIIRLSKIDFKNTDFTEFDYAYMVNKLYSKFCKEIAEPSYYLKMAKSYLEDDEDDEEIFQGSFFRQEKRPKNKNLYLAYNSDNRSEYRRRRNYNEDNNYENRYENRYDTRYENNKYENRYDNRYENKYENNRYENRYDYDRMENESRRYNTHSPLNRYDSDYE